MDIRDRIIDYKKLKASELQNNPGNWRTHPDAQKDVIRGVLREVGITGALLAYYSKRNDNQLTLIDGHLRKDTDPDIVWPVLITDLSDEEADLVMAVYDPISAMAGLDKEKTIALIDNVNTGEWAVRELIQDLMRDAKNINEDEIEKEEKKAAEGGPDEMELLPFEHYDYILLMFKNELDWIAAVDIFGLHRQVDPRKTNKIGLARVVDGAKVVRMLRGENESSRTQQGT